MLFEWFLWIQLNKDEPHPSTAQHSYSCCDSQYSNIDFKTNRLWKLRRTDLEFDFGDLGLLAGFCLW